MSFRVQILDSKSIDHRKWYLCKGNLKDYLENLKEEFYHFAIQRRIVRNQYLDQIYQTIKDGDPIPIVTLTNKVSKLNIGPDNYTSIDLKNIEVLDGLQRTFRLWAYLNVAKLYNKDQDSNPRDFSRKVKGQYPLFFDTGVISTKLIRELIDKDLITDIIGIFSKFEIYFVIWCNLSPEEVIKKMLLLNAGQKAVSKTHQFELLFLHFYNEIDSANSHIELFREKDTDANRIKRGERNIGQFMFSSIIIGLQSFVDRKPQRVSTDDLFIFDDDKDEDLIYKLVFNTEYLNLYLTELYELDQVIDKQQGGKEWFVKDTSISGVLAAVGDYIDLDEGWSKDKLYKETKRGFAELKSTVQSKGLQLNEFTNQYNELSSRSVNIGTFIRKVVFEYISKLINGENASWTAVFDEIKPGGKS